MITARESACLAIIEAIEARAPHFEPRWHRDGDDIVDRIGPVATFILPAPGLIEATVLVHNNAHVLMALGRLALTRTGLEPPPRPAHRVLRLVGDD